MAHDVILFSASWFKFHPTKTVVVNLSQFGSVIFSSRNVHVSSLFSLLNVELYHSKIPFMMPQCSLSLH